MFKLIDVWSRKKFEFEWKVVAEFEDAAGEKQIFVIGTIEQTDDDGIMDYECYISFNQYQNLFIGYADDLEEAKEMIAEVFRK